VSAIAAEVVDRRLRFDDDVDDVDDVDERRLEGREVGS
jgi:hypothetical protein